MDNFAEKVCIQIHSEIRALSEYMGKKYAPAIFLWMGRETGLPPDLIIKKFSNAEKEGVVFNVKDQKGNREFFHKEAIGGLKYAANNGGLNHYGFGGDFFRAAPPEGVTTNEGCKLTVHTSDNKKVKDGLGDITNEQLGAISLCCNQSIQQCIRYAPSLYFMVSGGLEHTALNHSVKLLENGKVQVTVNEKSGTAFFKFHMVMEISRDGIVDSTEREIKLVSVEQLKAYQKEHPDVRV